MLNKEQKKKLVADLKTAIKGKKNVVLVEFSKVGAIALNKLRSDLKALDTNVKVIKKRLFNVAAKDLGIDYQPNKSLDNLAVILSPKELVDVASVIHKFGKLIAKEKGSFNVKLVYDAEVKSIVAQETFNMIATLPSKEVLLAQLVGMIAAPIRSLMFVLKAKSEKGQ